MSTFANAAWRVGMACLWLGLQPVAVPAQSQQEQTLTLDQAIAIASANEPAFAAAQAEFRASRLERTNARVALLPTAVYHNQAVYTQPNGVVASRIGQTANAPSPLFIANNAVREYASQGVLSETLGVAQVGSIRLADANSARAEAALEIARRGLVSTVVALYYGSIASSEKVTIAECALAETDHFLDITEKREAARESAHADVLKAQLQQQQRQREFADARLAAEKARLELAVLLFPDPTTLFKLAPEAASAVLPDRAAIETLARQNNPELRGALAALAATSAETYLARAALLPNLGLNFTYGIDATNFGVNGPDGIRNLGYSMSAQLDIPVWDWLTTERKIKQTHLQTAAAKVALSAAQRRLIASLSEFYDEADEASRQMASFDASAVTARESLRLTTLRYVDGESTVLEVVDAESTLTSAENAQIEGRVRYRLALADLETMTGKL